MHENACRLCIIPSIRLAPKKTDSHELGKTWYNNYAGIESLWEKYMHSTGTLFKKKSTAPSTKIIYMKKSALYLSVTDLYMNKCTLKAISMCTASISTCKSECVHMLFPTLQRGKTFIANFCVLSQQTILLKEAGQTPG